jgi:hypothetical protein
MQERLEPGSIFRRSDSVAQRVICDEVLIIPIRNHPSDKLGVYTLNRTAAFIWELLDGSRTLEDLRKALCTHFEVEPERARADIEACCCELLECGVLEMAG